VIGAPLNQVDRILAKATLADLSEAERGIANFLLDRFGLDRAVATLDTIRQRISDIRNRIKDTISDIARAKVALGFAYEYRRMRQDTTVAQCTVTDARLTAHHPDLVRGKFDALFAEAERGENGSKLEHYLYQTKIKSVRSWGFSLSIGKWIAIGSRDTKTLQRVDRHSASGRIQRAFVGTRGYRETGDDQDRWSGDLSASMPAYSRAPVPLVSEFEAGVAFSWFEPTRKLDDKTISTWLDHGVLWGAIREGDTARVRETLAAGLKQKCAMGAQLTFPHEAFSIMRRRISSANPKEIGVGLGAAMPWSEVAGRHSVTLRRKLYGPLWEFYLSKPEHEHRVGRDFAIAARKHLADQGFEDLASMEQLYAGSSRPHDGNVFCGLIDLNPSTFQNCRDFFNGVRRLDAGVLSAEPDNGVMARIFEEMENLWRQSHHVRGVGAYLLEIARITGVLKHVTQSMSVTVGVGTASEQVFVVGS
jgi:hypothetical protein